MLERVHSFDVTINLNGKLIGTYTMDLDEGQSFIRRHQPPDAGGLEAEHEEANSESRRSSSSVHGISTVHESQELSHARVAESVDTSPTALASSAAPSVSGSPSSPLGSATEAPLVSSGGAPKDGWVLEHEVGTRLAVYWRLERTTFWGNVVEHTDGQTLVHYEEDDDKQWHDFDMDDCIPLPPCARD